jgi:hypothetical protein
MLSFNMSKPAYFKRTDRLDEYGAIVFELTWGNQSIDCISGLPGCDPVHPHDDYAGSCRPIPEGIYAVDKPVYEHPEDCHPAIGPDWIALHPLTNIGGRSGLLIHRDWNWAIAPGTAGCPAPLKHQDMDVIVAAVEAGEFDELIVDYGFGTV